MDKKYDHILKWVKHSTREEHHIPEIEEFAKNNHQLFMKFHVLSKPIVASDEDSEEYLEGKKSMIELFETNKEAFKPFLDIIEDKFKGKYF